ncbi:hypothetical protein L5470_08260 [Synechococcus sp. PCC 6717]|nr:hypothetical protein [Synechococcus sp. PCC 6717]
MREYVRIQTFLDSWEFCGSSIDKLGMPFRLILQKLWGDRSSIC